MELARCEFIDRRENVIALGPSGTGKTHVTLRFGLAACQKGRRVGFTTAAALVRELMEAVDDRRLQRLQKSLATHDLLIIDELGFVPLSKTGAELLFDVISQRYERGSIITISNLPFDEWTEVFGSERLTGAILDRLTHHVHILEMNGESFRLHQSRKRNPCHQNHAAARELAFGQCALARVRHLWPRAPRRTPVPLSWRSITPGNGPFWSEIDSRHGRWPACPLSSASSGNGMSKQLNGTSSSCRAELGTRFTV